MASGSSSLLCEDQFLCPICLDVFTRPVSTPCGHNFCISCISSYWNGAPVCWCPVCKETFTSRPDLKVNTFISELAEQLKSLQVTDTNISNPDQQQRNASCSGGGGGGVVLCDICIDGQQEAAVKSCLECLASYCDPHLEPHHRAAGLKRHKLVEPVANLEDKICKAHSRLLTSFCKQDEVLLCALCASSRHGNHDIAPVQRAYAEMKGMVGEAESRVKTMLQERQQKLRSTRESLRQSKVENKDAVANGVRDLTALVFAIRQSQAELVKVMEDKQRAAEEQAERFIGSVEREIAELQRTSATLEELKQNQDQLGFLQSFPIPSLVPHTTDLSTFSFTRHVEIHHVRKSLSQTAAHMRKLLDEMDTDVKNDGTDVSSAAQLRYAQQYEEAVVLDPDTAHPLLILTDDRRQVRYSMGSGLWGQQNLNPNMFTEHLAVLGRRGFSSGRFYFEVFMGRKAEWCLGVATASIQRRGALCRRPLCGLWALWFLEDKFETFSAPNSPVHLGKVERVGVFVDYDGGEVSFYDVQSATLVYSFTDCLFTEELFPYFNPCDNEYGSNLDPMVIVAVNQ